MIQLKKLYIMMAEPRDIQTQDDVSQLSQNLMETNQEVTFYTITDAHYFIGTVALLNSLRLTNHQYELILLDCGLTASQRKFLSSDCKIVDMSSKLATNSALFKPFPYLLNPSGTVVIIDSDMIVTRALEDIVKLAQRGKICVFPDPESERWFKEWQQMFDLPNVPRHQTYVNTGFVALSTIHWPNLLGKWWEACQKILSHPTIYEGAANTEPSAQADQDALNALLMSEVSLEALALQPKEEEVFQDNSQDLQIIDAQTLTCKCGESATAIVHSNGQPKPWNSQAWRFVRWRNSRVRLLRRVLSGGDVELKLPPSELPIWLRPGILAQMIIYGLYILNTVAPVIRLVKRLVKRKNR